MSEDEKETLRLSIRKSSITKDSKWRIITLMMNGKN
jgi:hypothetical protein